MKKTTQNSLSKRLAQYGALTVAIAGAADASGQIVYTDVAPDFNGGTNTDYSLDLNNDGTVDFEIGQEVISYYGGLITVNRLALFPLGALNEGLVAAASSADSYVYPFALDAGNIISSAQTTWNNNGFTAGYQSLNWALSYYGSLSANDGYFVNVTDKYVGLRFDISGQTHYGWVRLDVNDNATVWTVKDYAYNTTPDAPINAGQTLSLGDNQMPNVKVVALNKSIGLYNLSGNTEYRLVSVSGQSILKGSTSNTTHIVEANTVSNGVYVLELRDVDTNAILRKKVIL